MTKKKSKEKRDRREAPEREDRRLETLKSAITDMVTPEEEKTPSEKILADLKTERRLEKLEIAIFEAAIARLEDGETVKVSLPNKIELVIDANGFVRRTDRSSWPRTESRRVRVRGQTP